MRAFIRVCASLVLALVLLGTIGGFQIAAAQEPERGISLQSFYRDVVVSIGEEIELYVMVTNTGKVAENVRLLVASAPEGWECQFEGDYPKKIIRSVFLPPEAEDEENYWQGLTVTATPPPTVEAGDYSLVTRAATEDGAIESTLRFTIGLTGKVAAPKVEGEVVVTADYPVLQQESGKIFEYEIRINNRREEDLAFDLLTGIPVGWDAFFTPAYSEEMIAALGVRSGTTMSVKLYLIPPLNVVAGEFPVTFQASSGEITESIDLKAIVTGTYELVIDTVVGEVTGLLNTKATAGEPGHISLIAWNAGSAPLENVSFSSVKPTGWNVTFTPDRLGFLSGGMSREIDVSIQPTRKAIAGDYSVTLSAYNDKVSEQVELRVSVQTPTTWGWAGVIIVIIVIAALIGIFARLRRR